MPSPYSKLLTAIGSAVAEKKKPYHFLTERHLQATWLEQKYFKGLKTDQGEPIQVLSPGIWNLEAGPDFRKAHLKIGAHEFFGDVELHLADESWQQHGHHVDSRYDQVILHISLWQPKGATQINTARGSTPFKTYLENFLTIPISRLCQLIDLDLYPYKKFVGSGHCAQALFKELSSTQISQFFEKAADWRLERKRHFLNYMSLDPRKHIPCGIAMALGYKNNSDQFITLFSGMQRLNFATEEQLIAWLIGSCGFFNTAYEPKWGRSSYYQRLKDLFAPYRETAPCIRLHLNQIRPFNHPIRRLVILAKMHSDPSLLQLHDRLDGEWDRCWFNCYQKKQWWGFIAELISWLPSYRDDYWNSHYLFETEAKSQFLALFGENTKREIVINIFLPLLAGRVAERGHPAEILAFQHLFRSLPASKASKRDYLIHRFFGNSSKGSLLKNAYVEQGAFQLHYDFCSHFEASCEGCPFVERYKSIHNTPTFRL